MTLSPRQRAILLAISDSCEVHGYAPTVREIQAAAHISTQSVVVYHLDRLQVAGLVLRDERLARTLRLTQAGREAVALCRSAK